ncbi:hypothetical protein F4777DRAFT_589714 [Nemania sp. FL0916]|nr:hypothetical protein F4777DRAFT_589714 [Nemania sp. FL0916]
MKWPCVLQPCDQPASRSDYNQCDFCHRHFCAKHVESELHPCLKFTLNDLSSARRKADEEVISRLLANINCDALRERAETLRNGVKCAVNLPSANQATNFNIDAISRRNYYGSIAFDDGKTWLAKFRLPNHSEPPLQERNFDRRSEFATYLFLARTAVPVPEAYDCADDDDPMNPVGAGYILLERLAGKPLVWHEASEMQKEKFSRQLADIYINLEQHPFEMLGRLQLSSKGVPEIGPAFFGYDSNGNLIPFGPFSHSNGYYEALIQQKIQLIKTGEIANFEPVIQYLVYRNLLDPLPPQESGPFFLRHVDSRDANFLVDDDYNITGIIGWELAISTSKSSAFQSPFLMYDLGELYDQQLSTPSEDEKRLSKILREEKGAAELSKLAENKLHFRVEQIIKTEFWRGRNLVDLLRGWWKATQGGATFEPWYPKAFDLYGDGGLGDRWRWWQDQ